MFCAVSYVIRAQYLPYEENDWALETEGISKFRGEAVVSIKNLTPALPIVSQS